MYKPKPISHYAVSVLISALKYLDNNYGGPDIDPAIYEALQILYFRLPDSCVRQFVDDRSWSYGR